MPFWLKITVGIVGGVSVFFVLKYVFRKRKIQKIDTAHHTTHFRMSEFDCKDGTPVPEALRPNVMLLMQNLEVIRAALGGKSITITSGFRTPSHNRKVGGEPNSMHLEAKAADITVAGVTPAKVQDTIRRLIVAGKIQDGGLGVYPTFTHYDIGPSRRW